MNPSKKVCRNWNDLSKLPGSPDFFHVEEHGIKAEQVHPHVLYICDRLYQLGYTAWLVGGAVRDLLLGSEPKDFDLACSISTHALCRIFRNARVVGRRFPVVLVEFPDLCVQMSSFRSEPLKDKEGMIYKDYLMGTPYEDVQRRDFTINALLLELKGMTVIDYVNGVKDLRARKLKSIQPAEQSFTEDPVRILRAVRFSHRLQFKIPPEMRKAIAEKRHMILRTSRYRLNQELHRFCQGEMAMAHFKIFDELGLISFLLKSEKHSNFFSKPAIEAPFQYLTPLLKQIDNWHAQGGEVLSQTVVLLAFLAQLAKSKWLQVMFYQKGILASSRRILMRRLLASFLSEWGFLSGQINPAIKILKAAQQLMADNFVPIKATAVLPGTREALLLLNLLAGGALQLKKEQLQAGLKILPQLPDLPILDHPRPTNRLIIKGEQHIKFRRRRSYSRGTAKPPFSVGNKIKSSEAGSRRAGDNKNQ